MTGSPHHTADDARRAASAKRSVLLVLTVLCGVAAVYFGLVAGQISTAQTKGEELEKKTSEQAVTLGAAMEMLRENPQSAANVAPQLGTIVYELDQLTADAAQLNYNMMPTGASARRDYQQKLSEYVSGIRYHAERFRLSTTLVVDRTDTVRKVSEAFQQLDKLSDPKISESALRMTLQDVKLSVDASVKGLRSIASSTSTVYSSDALIARLSAISGAIGEIVTGLRIRDQGRLDRAAQSFTQLMKDDWESMFTERDMRGNAQIASSLKAVSDRRTRVSSAREQVAEVQKSIGLFALLFLVLALVFGVWARMQRPA